MNVLLDTHAFLWWIAGDSIPQLAGNAIRDPNNVVWFSAASAWEITIKANLGKLRFPDQASRFIEQQRILNRFNWLPIDIKALEVLCELPVQHRDPFDRLLIAQALALDYTLITTDSAIALYDVKHFWA